MLELEINFLSFILFIIAEITVRYAYILVLSAATRAGSTIAPSDLITRTTKNTDINVDHDTSGLIKMDSTAKANYLAKMVQNGLMTRNEGREAVNLPAVDGGDELTVQTNLTPLEDLENVSQGSQSARSMPTEVRQ